MVEINILFISGIFIVAITAFDFFYTTLSINGAGLISKTATAALSSFFLFLNSHVPNRKALKLSGVSHILISMMIWICLLWAGLFLILSSNRTAIVHAASQELASPVNIFYFSGYVLSTLGNGEFVPAGKFWQLVVAVFSFSGFIFITTGMSYILNLTSAILHKRTLALFISNMGESPEEIVANTYNKGNYTVLIKRIPILQEKVNKHTQNHYAYPISHYFYSVSRAESLAVNLTKLDEALTIIEYLIDKDISVENDIKILRNAISEYLKAIQHSFISRLEDNKDVSPNVEKLHKLGVPAVDHAKISQMNSFVEQRRSLLSGYLKSSGWIWHDVYRKENGKK